MVSFQIQKFKFLHPFHFLLKSYFLFLISFIFLLTSCESGNRSLMFSKEEKILAFEAEGAVTINAKEGQTFQVVFKLKEKASHDVNVVYNISPVTNTSDFFWNFFADKKPNRFDKMSGYVLVPEDSLEGQFPLTAFKNETYGDRDVFDLLIQEPGASEVHYLLILEDGDEPPAIKLKNTYANKGDTLKIPIELSKPSSYPVELTIDFPSDGNNTALIGQDFELPTQLKYFMDPYVQEISIPIKTFEKLHSAGDKEFTIHYQVADDKSCVFKDNVSTSKIIILDTDLKYNLSIKDVIANRSDALAQVIIYLDTPSNENIQFDLNTQDLTALAGDDYKETHLTDVTIPAGKTFTTVNIPLMKNIYVTENINSDLNFEVALSNAKKATLSPAHHTAVVTLKAKNQKSLPEPKPQDYIITPHLTTSSSDMTAVPANKFELRFNRKISNFELSDLQITNGVASDLNVLPDPKVSGQNIYSFNVTGEKDGLIEVYLKKDSVKDELGNDNNIPSELITLLLDRTKVDVKLEFLTDSSQPTQNLNALALSKIPIEILVSFNKKITRFDPSDIKVENSVVSQILNSNGSADLTQPEDHFKIILKNQDYKSFNITKPVRVGILEDAVTDKAGNSNTASEIITRYYDLTPPEVKISINKISQLNLIRANESIEVLYTLSEDAAKSDFNPNGFSEANIKATLGQLTPDIPFCVGVVCKAFYKADVNIQNSYAEFSTQNDYTDLAQNIGTQASPLKIEIDSVVSTITMSADLSNLKKGSTTGVQWLLPEGGITNFAIERFSVTNGTLLAQNPFCNPLPEGGALKGIICKATFTPKDNFQGLGEIAFKNSDLSLMTSTRAGNRIIPGSPLTLNIDTLQPVVSSVKISSTSIKAKEFALVEVILSELPGDYKGSFSEANLVSAGGTFIPRKPFCIEKSCKADFKPQDNFTGQVSIAIDSKYNDALGNPALPSPPPSYLNIDTQIPTIQMTSDVKILKKGAVANIKWIASEKLNDFNVSKHLIVSNGTLNPYYPFCFAESASSTRWVCMAQFKSQENFQGVAKISLNPAQGLTDLAGNLVNPIDPLELTIDTSTPSITVSSTAQQIKYDEPVEIQFKLSKDFTFSNSQIMVTGKNNLTNAGTLTPNSPFCRDLICTAKFNPNPDLQGIVVFNVNGPYTDLAGNIGEAVVPLELPMDSVQPVVDFDLSSTLKSLNLKNTSTTLRWKLSKNTTQFSLKNISVNNGTLNAKTPFCNLDPSDSRKLKMICEADFIPTPNTQAQQAVFTFSNTEPFTDTFKNVGLLGSTPLTKSLTIVIDNVAPSVEINPLSLSLSMGQSTVIEFKLSEAPGSHATAFSANQITFSSGGSIKANIPFCLPRGNFYICTAELIPNSNFEGKVSISVNNTFTDPAGNAGSLIPSQVTNPVQISIDTLPPKATITTPNNPNGYTSTLPLKFAVNFSESLSTPPKLEDFNYGQPANTAVLSGSGKSFTIDVTPSTLGPVTLSLPEGKVTDFFNNINPLASGTLVYDKTPPTLNSWSASSMGPLTIPNPSTKITLNFSENISAVDANSGLTLSNFLASNNAGKFSALSCSTSNTCEVTFTANSNFSGSTALSFTGTFKDLSGNTGILASGFSALNFAVIDTVAPKVSISMSPSVIPSGVSSSTIILVFSEPLDKRSNPVMNISSGAGGTMGSFYLDPSDPTTKTYKGTFSKNSDTNGSLTIALSGGSYFDLNKNPGIGNTFTVSWQGTDKIVDDTIGRHWQFGSNAISCYDYMYPSDPNKKYMGAVGDGVYLIDPDGPGGVAPFKVYCDMNSDGGGWTLAIKIARGSGSFYYSSGNWTGSNTLNETDLTLDLKDAKYYSYNSVKGTVLKGCMDGHCFRYQGSAAITPYDYINGPQVMIGGHPGIKYSWVSQYYSKYFGLNMQLSCDRIRFGYVANNENNMSCMDTAIGFGGEAAGGSRGAGELCWDAGGCPNRDFGGTIWIR